MFIVSSFDNFFPFLKIFVEQRRIALDGGEVSLISKFNLVDLAGEWKCVCARERERERVCGCVMSPLSVCLSVQRRILIIFPWIYWISSCIHIQGRRNGNRWGTRIWVKNTSPSWPTSTLAFTLLVAAYQPSLRGHHYSPCTVSRCEIISNRTNRLIIYFYSFIVISGLLVRAPTFHTGEISSIDSTDIQLCIADTLTPYDNFSSTTGTRS